MNEPVRDRKAEPGRDRDRSYPPSPEPLAIEVVDSHCHLDIRDGDEWMSVDEALSSAKAAGVGGIVQIGCDLPPTDFAAMARAMGAEAHTIRSPEDLLNLDIATMCARQGPTLLDVLIDPDEVPPMNVRMRVLAGGL